MVNRQADPVVWLEYASADLRTAQLLIDKMNPPSIEIVSYHCQQCVEKALKGFLFHKGVQPPRTHDLSDLCETCTEYCTGFADFERACVNLSQYAVATRYPSPFVISEYEMHHALEIAQRIYEYALKQTQN